MSSALSGRLDIKPHVHSARMRYAKTLSVSEAAEFLNLSEALIRKYCKDRILKSFRTSGKTGKWRIFADSIEEGLVAMADAQRRAEFRAERQDAMISAQATHAGVAVESGASEADILTALFAKHRRR